MDNSTQIGFQLVGIRTIQFAIVDPNFDTRIPLKLAVDFNVNKDNELKIVSISVSVKFLFEDKIILIIDAASYFRLSDDSWNSFKLEDSNSIVLPSGFLTHLAVLAVGTTRGILHAKTEGTKFNEIVLPTLNISELFKSDLRIE